MTPILDTIRIMLDHSDIAVGLANLRSIMESPDATAKAREALSQALTGRVLPDPKPQPKEADKCNTPSRPL